MNYRPLLKSLALLVITWMIFFVAKTTFQGHSLDHFEVIPARADAVLIMNSNKVGDKLFYQRVFNEESYERLVSVDEELEKQIISDAIGSGVDLLGHIAIFSYSANDMPIIGFTVYTEDEKQFDDFIQRYADKFGIADNIVYGVKKNAGIILFSDSANRPKLVAELNNVISGKYKSATDQSWFEPLYNSNFDLIAYYDPSKSSENHYTKVFRLFTPDVIKHSYTFMSLEHGELSFTHHAHAGMDISKLLRPQSKGGYDNEAGMGIDISVFLDEYNKHAESPLNNILNIRKGDTVVQLKIDSLLNGEIAYEFDGIKFNLASNAMNGIPFDIYAELCLGINPEYWEKTKNLLLNYGIMNLEDSIYRLPVKPYLDPKTRIILNIVEKGSKLLVSIDKRQAEEPFFYDDLEKEEHYLFRFNTDRITKNIRYPLSPDMSSLKDVKGGYLKIESFDGKKLILAGRVQFRRTNHSLLEALHIITYWDDYVTPLEIMLKHVSASDL